MSVSDLSPKRLKKFYPNGCWKNFQLNVQIERQIHHVKDYAHVIVALNLVCGIEIWRQLST